MKLEKNGKRSSGKITCHTNICYHFATNRINDGDLTVEYCPTLIVSDYSILSRCMGVSFAHSEIEIYEDDTAEYSAETEAFIKKKIEERKSRR